MLGRYPLRVLLQVRVLQLIDFGVLLSIGFVGVRYTEIKNHYIQNYNMPVLIPTNTDLYYIKQSTSTSRSLARARHITLRHCGAHVQSLGELSTQLDFSYK